MAIFHCSIQIIGRSDGRSAVACSAYRSGSKLYDEELQKDNDYTGKQGVVYSDVMLPENAPAEYADREKLWNAVQQIEKQSNAQLARELEVALPRELSREQQIKLIREYVQENFVSKGMAAQIDIHDKGDGNPHAHLMLTTRGFKENGQWAAKEKKDYALDENGERIPIIDPATGEQKLDNRNRKQWKRITVQANDWNDPGNAEIWRASWAASCNRYLDEEHHIDHRSYARQGKEQEPTIHEGYAAREMEARGEVSERCEHNRQVRERNSLLAKLKAEYEKLQRSIADLKHRFDQWKEEQKQIADRRREERKQGKTGYALIDNLLEKRAERERLAKAPEVRQLTDQLRELTAAGASIAKDHADGAEVLNAEETGDFVKELVAKANRRTLEEKYQTVVDDTFLERLAAEYQNIEAQREKVLARLRQLRPDIDFEKEVEKQQAKTNKSDYGDYE